MRELCIRIRKIHFKYLTSIYKKRKYLNTEWRPHPGPQELALKKTEFEILYGGARGGGKTDAGIVWCTDDVDNPRLRTLIIRKNADDLSDWRDRAQRMYRLLGGKIVGHPGVIRFPSGATFKMGHLKDENAYTKYQGHEYQRMLIEELTQIPTEKSYLQLISSCRSTVPGLPSRIFATTNPGGNGHGWVKKRFIDTADLKRYDYIDEFGKSTEGFVGKTYIDPVTGLSRIYIPAKVDDNPTLIKNDPGYLKMLEGLKDVDIELWKAWRLGSWDVFAGQAFTEFNYATHVTDRMDYPLEQCKKIISYDWGYNDPGSAQWLAICPENQYGVSRIYCYREIHQNKTTPEKWAEMIAVFTKYEETEFMVLPHDCYSDKEGKESIAQIFKRIIICPIKRGDTLSRGARRNRVALTHQALSIAPDGKPYMQILPRNKSLIETLPNLVYDDTNIEDIDTSGDDHDYDAMSLGLKTIAATWNINSGPLKPRSLVKKPQWRYDGNQVSTVDFTELFKKKKRRSPEI